MMGPCRVCMKSDEDMRSIFEEPDRLYDKLLFCTGLLMRQGDGKPNQICTECTLNLEIAHKFKTDCLHSDMVYHSALLKGIISIKKEPLESDHVSFQDHDPKNVKVEIKKECLTFEVPLLIRNDNNCIKVEKKKGGRPCKQKVEVKPKLTKPVASKRKEPKSQEDKTQRNTLPLECTICQIKFQTQKELSKHKKGKHKKKWICELCGKEMTSSKQLHLKFHQPPQYQCDNCPYKAYYKYDLSKHMQIHLGKKEYICDKCPNVAYHSHSNLRAHIRNIHLKERNYQCDICGKHYFAKYSLKRHVESHTEIKRHSCHICKKLYTRRQAWKDHLHNEHGVTLPRGKPGPKLKYDKESALKQQLTINSAVGVVNNDDNVSK